MNVVVAGGTGFIGSTLVPKLLDAGHEVVLLTRSLLEVPASPGLTRVRWDGETQGDWASRVREADAVINLAGESIGSGRWTPARKARILGSRVNAARALMEALSVPAKKTSVIISSSAVGFYGSVPSGDVDESHPPGSGFLSDVCVRWEQEALALGELASRLVVLRLGVVLGREGGALGKMLLPFRLFAGGPIGSGKQWFPWVHAEDVAGVILFALATQALEGPVNVVAPGIVDMKSFCSALGAALSRPSWLPVPSLALRAGLGEMADMVLTGQRAVPAKLLALGYHFAHPELGEALSSVL